MLRRPFCGMAVGLLLGILTAAYENMFLPAAVGMVCIGLAAVVRIRKRYSEEKVSSRTMLLRLGLIGAAFFLGGCRYTAETAKRETYFPYLKDGMQLSVQGELAGKEMRNGQYIYELTSCMIGLNPNSNKYPVSCNRILVYSDTDEFSIGEILVLDGKIELWQSAVNEGNFDAKSFYEARKIDFKVKNAQVHAVYGKKSRWREGLWQLRLRVKQVYASVMNSREGGILTTMVLGDKELLGQETKKLYQVCGLSHILAISGLHISVIGLSVYQLLRRLRLGFAGAGILAGGLMYAYGTMAGMGTSVKRAVFMFLLMLLAQVVGRSYDSLNALGAAAVILLWSNPALQRDAGFLFSFAAVIGVVWVGKGEGKSSRLLSGCAIQFVTLPLLAWYYYEIPIYAAAVNLLILPFMGVLLALGAAGGIIGLFSEPAASFLLFPCQKFLEGTEALCSIGASLPNAMLITGKPAFWKMAVYFFGLAVLTLVRHCRERRKRRFVAGWTLGGVLLVAFLFFPFRGGFELDILDVGQGDAGFIRTENGHCIFVDGGSSNVQKVGEYRILPFLKAKGIRQIDYWFVSHTDQDHISGLKEILQTGYPVKQLVFAEKIVQDEVFAELVQLAEIQKTKLLFVNTKDTLHLGEASIRILFPYEESSDKNAGSLVFCYEENEFSGIFTGDIGTAEEKKMLSLGAVCEVDFYKAAHHGSKNSNSKEFLSTLNPAASAISCSLTNRYGHPGEAAVEHMKEAGSKVVCTMNAGQIKLTREGELCFVQKYLEPLDVFCFSVVE